MRMIIPQDLRFIFSNVLAPSSPLYSSATTYAVGNQCYIDLSDGDDDYVGPPRYRVFEAMTQTANVAPVVGGNANWLDLGMANISKMFDKTNNARTVADPDQTEIHVVISPPKFTDTLCLLGLRNVSKIIVEQYLDQDDETPVTVQEIDNFTSEFQVGWWNWLFGERTYKRSAIIELTGMNLAPVFNIKLIGNFVEVGQCFFGLQHDIGESQWGAKPEIIDYSIFKADDFGNMQYTPRQNSRENNYTVMCPTADFDRVFYLFENYISSLVFMDGNNNGQQFESLMVYGKVTSVKPGLQYAMTPIDIRIQGLT